MTSIELMQDVVTRYTDRDRRERWLGLSTSRDKLYKKLGDFAHHLGTKAVYTSDTVADLFVRFIQEEGATWVWDFSQDPPVRVTAFDQIPSDYLGRSLIALAEKSRRAVYSYDEGDSWKCA